jgi:ABC-type uncharacterized transport system involved in gliding motility auxiliary subunit
VQNENPGCEHWLVVKLFNYAFSLDVFINRVQRKASWRDDIKTFKKATRICLGGNKTCYKKFEPEKSIVLR